MAALFVIAKMSKTTQISIDGEMDKQTAVQAAHPRCVRILLPAKIYE